MKGKLEILLNGIAYVYSGAVVTSTIALGLGAVTSVVTIFAGLFGVFN